MKAGRGNTMVRICLLTFLVTFIPVCGQTRPASAGLRPENFRYFADIRSAMGGEFRRDQLYRLRPGADIMERCDSDCRDIRLFDAGGSEVPYSMVEHRIAGRKTETYAAELLLFREEGNRSVLTVRMPDKALPVSLLRLETPDRDFRISSALEGSNDRETWKWVADDILYDFSSQVDLRKTDIRFPASAFRYYRLTMSCVDQARAGQSGQIGQTGNEQLRLKYNGLDFSATGLRGRKIRISGVQAETAYEGSEETVYDEAPYAGFTATAGPGNETVITMKTGLPFDRLYLDVTNPYYYRKVRIEYRTKGPGRTDAVETGVVYRFPVGRREESKPYLDFSGCRGWEYRIVIENGNSAPLQIGSVRLAWKRRYLYFIPLADSSGYRLCVGSGAAGPPVYDLGRFVNQENWHNQQALEAESSRVMPTVGFIPATEGTKAAREKTVLISIIVLLVFGMGFWLYTLMRKTDKR